MHPEYDDLQKMDQFLARVTTEVWLPDGEEGDPGQTGTFARLKTSFACFHQHFCVEQEEKFRRLAACQTPEVMILSCCDSRTDPALLFSCEPGDIFVHRAIGALVPPYGEKAGACIRAATAYAVEQLRVRDLVVLGHTACGGIKGLVNGCCGTPLEDWLDIGRPVLDKVRRGLPDADIATLQEECERQAPLFSLRNLATYPWVRAGLDNGTLNLHAWFFDLHTGHLFAYNFADRCYEPLHEDWREDRQPIRPLLA